MAGSPYYTSRNWYNCGFKFRLASGPLYGFRRLKEFRALCAVLTLLVKQVREQESFGLTGRSERCIFSGTVKEKVSPIQMNSNGKISMPILELGSRACFIYVYKVYIEHMC